MKAKEYSGVTNDYLAALIAAYRDIVSWNNDLERLYSEVLKAPSKDLAKDIHIVEFNRCKAQLTDSLRKFEETGVLVEELQMGEF